MAQSPPPLALDLPKGITANSPLRNGETLYLITQRGDSYEWSGPNGFSSESPIVEIHEISPAETGVYSVTVTYPDSTVVCSTIVSLKPPVSTCLIAENNDVCINAYLDLQSTCISPTYTYSWSITIPNISISSVPNPAPIKIPNGTLPGTYSVSLTVYSGSTVVCSDVILIDIYDCCLPQSNVDPVNILHNENNANPSILFTQNTVILGTFVVSTNFTLPSLVDEVTLLPNANIVVSDVAFSASNVDFHGCSDLWNSIILVKNARIRFQSDTLRDGYWAIRNESISQSNVPVMTLIECELRDNRHCILLSGCSPVLDLHGNYFRTVNNVLPGLTQKGDYGIIVDNCSGTTISGLGFNKFHSLKNGITAYYSNLHIGSDATIFRDFEGGSTAIRAFGLGSQKNFSLTKLGNSSIDDFDNCDYGIVSDDYSCDIRFNKFNDVNHAVIVENGLHKSLIVNNNTIVCHESGITVNLANGPFYSIDICENNIAQDWTTYLPSTFGGILINGFNNAYDDHAVIDNNQITVDGGHYGIWLNLCHNYLVTENSVTLTQRACNISGIGILGGSGHFVQCNNIVGPSTLSPNPYFGFLRPVGMSVVNSPNGQYGFNETDQTYIGVLFDQVCSNTDIYSHDCADHSFGIYYTSTGITGDQYHNGNRWLGSYTNYALFEDNQVSIGGVYRIGYNGSVPVPYWPSSKVVSTGRLEATGLSPCVGGGGSSAGAMVIHGFSTLDSSVVTNQLSFSSYKSASRWKARRALINKIISDTMTMVSNPLMYSYADNMKSKSSGLFQALEKSISNSALLSLNDISVVKKMINSKSVLSHTISSIDSAIVDDTVALPSSKMLILRQKLVAQLPDIDNNLNKIIGDHNSKFISRIPDINSQNSLLPDTAEYESNEKVVNSILLNSIIQGLDLTISQKQIVSDIADQCPLTGGMAVYLARSIVNTFKDTLYSDFGKCIQNAKSVNLPTQVDTTLSFNFFPNPASKSITIESNGKQDGFAVLRVYDLGGKLVNSSSIQMNQKFTDIDVAELRNGIYTISVQHKQEEFRLGKLIITK